MKTCLCAKAVKTLSGPNFIEYRRFFQAKLKKSFIVPADTFDNVKGHFPVGFFVWDTAQKEVFLETILDVIDKHGQHIGIKRIHSYDDAKFINVWIIETRTKSAGSENLAFLCCQGNDFLNQNVIRIMRTKEELGNPRGSYITQNNLTEAAIYFVVRKVIPADWLNDRDQFLYPYEGWKSDKKFQSDCLTYTLFNNNISSQYGVNYWIPFTENEVRARTKFESNFMTDFISGKIESSSDLLTGKQKKSAKALVFSSEAKAVFEAGRELWRYYHSLPDCNVNASLYDIREHFQGRNSQGRMNAKSDDASYTELIGNLRSALKVLADKIAPKVYEFGFLKK